MKKKILFLIWALEVGGAERLLVGLSKTIPKKEWEITIGCITRKGVWADELEKLGVNVISLNKKIGFDPAILPKICRLIKAEKPDLINTHLWTADLWGRLGALIMGRRPIIVTEQNVDIWKRWYHKLIDRILFQWTDFVICVSDEVVKYYNLELKVPLRKIRMIPNAIDISRFDLKHSKKKLRNSLGLRMDDFVFVCAARLHPQKAHSVLLEATKLLRESLGGKKITILIVGEGELKAQLEDIASRLGLSDVVRFLGLREDIPEIFCASDAFVLSSDYEGLPLTILEAMAARLPVIATNVGGNSQVVINEKTGILVPPRNPEALAAAMERAIRNKVDIEKMGERGRMLVEKGFSIEAITNSTLELFEHALRQKKIV